MSTNPDTYEPKYADVEAVPVTGPDDYNSSEKRRAFFNAEPIFEMDINDGVTVPDEDFYDIHRVAVLNLATFHLVKNATSPNDTTLGDLADGGDQSSQYAQQFKDAYDDIIKSINEGGGPDGSAGRYMGSTGGSNDGSAIKTRNTRDADRMEHTYPYDRDARWPDR